MAKHMMSGGRGTGRSTSGMSGKMDHHDLDAHNRMHTTPEFNARTRRVRAASSRLTRGQSRKGGK